METLTRRLIESKKKHMKVLLFTLILTTTVAGTHLMVDPTTVSHWVIRMVGFTWLLEGILMILLWIKERMKERV